jgi:hypothetical protein
MDDTAFLIRFRSPERVTQHVIAARAEIRGDHLVLLNAQGTLAALFSLDTVESWNAVDVGCSSLTAPRAR